MFVLGLLDFEDVLVDVVQRLVLSMQHPFAKSVETDFNVVRQGTQLTSRQHVISVFSTRLWVDKMALYGSTTVSDTFGLGKIAKSQSIPISSKTQHE